jgi:hypothetical protein
VRFAVNEVPHGPAHAVPVAAPTIIHSPAGRVGVAGITTASGWPESSRAVSQAGPLGVMTVGVWQSLQPAPDTRYRPRSTFEVADDCGCTVDEVELPHAVAKKTMQRVRRFMTVLGLRFWSASDREVAAQAFDERFVLR